LSELSAKIRPFLGVQSSVINEFCMTYISREAPKLRFFLQNNSSSHRTKDNPTG